MVDATSFAYRYKGDIEQLRASVKKSCEKMALILKDEQTTSDGFSILASQKTNWLSTNWPVKFQITAEKVGETYALLIHGESSMGSFTQSANNTSKAQELLSLIKAFAPSEETSDA